MRQNQQAAMLRLLHSTGMTPIESRMGRYLRAPDDHPGAPAGFQSGGSGTTSAGDGNNQSGNSGGSGGDSGNANNTGADDFDPSSFWSDPEPEADLTPKGSAPAPDSGSHQEPDGNAFATQLNERIDGLEFKGVFSDDVTTAINQGDYEGANKAITENLRLAVKHGMGVQAQLLKKFSDTMVPAIEKRVTDMVNERLGKEKSTDALIKAIPSASNPKVGPGIRAIYEHALTRTKNDHAKAIEMTKSMMRTMASEMGSDVDLDVAPRDPHASRPSKPTNWLEELSLA